MSTAEHIIVGGADACSRCVRRPSFVSFLGLSWVSILLPARLGARVLPLSRSLLLVMALLSHMQSPLPMATTPPLPSERMEEAPAYRQADFSGCNTWDRIAAAGFYALSLWRISQDVIEEKAKNLIDGPSAKQKVL